MHLVEEVAAVLHPMPDRDDLPNDLVWNVECERADERRRDEAEVLELSWQESDGEIDPLLASLREAAGRREAIEQEIRRLIAYGREFVWPRPYTLASLADAAGMSISGTRTAYDQLHIAAVKRDIGRRPDQPPGGRSSTSQVGE